MHIGEVELADFRNYDSLSFTPAPHLNILTGPNAQGKTNLLEGLSVLLVGRSFRGARGTELPRWGSGGAKVTGELLRAGMSRRVQRTVMRRDDGVWAIGGEGCAWARAVTFGWHDLAIVHGEPQARRRFIDGFAGKIYPAHLTAVSRYRQIVARRNHLLQSGMDTAQISKRLAPWDEQLVQVGLEVCGRRRSAVAALSEETARLYPQLAGSGAARLEYQCSPRDTTAEGFRAALARRAGEEVRRGQTLVGPHRDDVAIEVDGSDLRVFGSRGQQRLMALALRLAEAGPVAGAVGTAPVMLLDDPLSELDEGARGRVLDHLGTAGQIFLTTCEGTLGGLSAAEWWEVRAGKVGEAAWATGKGAA